MQATPVKSKRRNSEPKAIAPVVDLVKDPQPRSSTFQTNKTARRAAKQAAASAVVCRKQVRTCTEESKNCHPKTSNRIKHRNQQYSIIALTDGSGAIAERYAYSAYGEATIADGSGTVLSGSAKDNRYTYTGREWDEVLSLYHFRARMYDAESGRFCGRDSHPYIDGMLLYQFFRSQPLFGTDPYGYFADDWTDVEGVTRWEEISRISYNIWVLTGTVFERGVFGNCFKVETFKERTDTVIAEGELQLQSRPDPQIALDNAKLQDLEQDVKDKEAETKVWCDEATKYEYIAGGVCSFMGIACFIAPLSPACWIAVGICTAAMAVAAINLAACRLEGQNLDRRKERLDEFKELLKNRQYQTQYRWRNTGSRRTSEFRGAYTGRVQTRRTEVNSAMCDCDRS